MWRRDRGVSSTGSRFASIVFLSSLAAPCGQVEHAADEARREHAADEARLEHAADEVRLDLSAALQAHLVPYLEAALQITIDLVADERAGLDRIPILLSLRCF